MAEQRTSIPPSAGPEGPRDPGVLGLENTSLGQGRALGELICHDIHGAVYKVESSRSEERLWARLSPEPLFVPSNLADLEHPNLSAVKGFAILDAGQGAVFFDAPPGESLAKRLEREKIISAQKTVPVALQVLSALQAIHAQGALHANLAPGNIFWSGNAKGEHEIRLIDHWLGAAGETQNEPYYRAPEQVRHHAPISHLTDIWSLGVILFEMLQGRRPFFGRTENEVVGKILLMDPHIKSSSNELKQALFDVVARSMTRITEARYQDAVIMISDLLPLQEKLDGLSATAMERLRQLVGPHPRGSVPWSEPVPQETDSSSALPRTEPESESFSRPAFSQSARAPTSDPNPPLHSGELASVWNTEENSTATTRTFAGPVPTEAAWDQTAPSEPLVELDEQAVTRRSVSAQPKKSRWPLWLAAGATLAALVAALLHIALSEDPVRQETPPEETKAAQPENQPRMTTEPVLTPPSAPAAMPEPSAGPKEPRPAVGQNPIESEMSKPAKSHVPKKRGKKPRPKRNKNDASQKDVDPLASNPFGG